MKPGGGRAATVGGIAAKAGPPQAKPEAAKALWIRLLSLVLILSSLLCLSGCNQKESDYSDATVSVPETYADYDVDIFHFKFEAGWTSASWDDVTEAMDSQGALITVANNLSIFYRLQSPAADIGTVNYMDFGFFEMGRQVATKDLEDIMDQIDDQATTLKKLGVSCDELQSARIRAYNKNEVEALTYCYLVRSETVTTVTQVALIAHGSRIYCIMLNDFTTGADSYLLERMLSGMTIDE